MRNNEYVASEVIERIRNILTCDVGDVISVLPAKEALTAIRQVTDSYAGDDADQDSRRSGPSSRVRSEDIAWGVMSGCRYALAYSEALSQIT